MIEGTVEQINSQPRGKYGNLAYSVKVGGTWYGWGFTAPQFGEGAYISFEETYNGQYANADASTVQILQQGNPPQQQQRQQQRPQGQPNRQQRQQAGAARQASGGAGGMSKDDYWKNKEERDKLVQKQIQWQASRNAAIEVVKVAVSADALALPAKKADKMDALVALVGELTSLFNEDVTNLSAGGRAQQPQQQEPQGDDFNDDIPF